MPPPTDRSMATARFPSRAGCLGPGLMVVRAGVPGSYAAYRKLTRRLKMMNQAAVRADGMAPLVLLDGADMWRRGREWLRGVRVRREEPVEYEPQPVPEMLIKLDPFNPAPGRGRR